MNTGILSINIYGTILCKGNSKISNTLIEAYQNNTTEAIKDVNKGMDFYVLSYTNFALPKEIQVEFEIQFTNE
jgi:hypothetical protein